ncbi:hypothetical protein DLM75_08050 [Leptospira stimsonii]|uniref:Uncharacterized protein n=1 Tax=Leptospira stimsonii TaxID=2202203 RepID=A0A396ZHW9_9LEPT|nr:hypothetical protein DLM75_08050 [Leptospira stimsonii]
MEIKVGTPLFQKMDRKDSWNVSGSFLRNLRTINSLSNIEKSKHELLPFTTPCLNRFFKLLMGKHWKIFLDVFLNEKFDPKFVSNCISFYRTKFLKKEESNGESFLLSKRL